MLELCFPRHCFLANQQGKKSKKGLPLCSHPPLPHPSPRKTEYSRKEERLLKNSTELNYMGKGSMWSTGIIINLIGKQEKSACLHVKYWPSWWELACDSPRGTAYQVETESIFTMMFIMHKNRCAKETMECPLLEIPDKAMSSQMELWSFFCLKWDLYQMTSRDPFQSKLDSKSIVSLYMSYEIVHKLISLQSLYIHTGFFLERQRWKTLFSKLIHLQHFQDHEVSIYF